jgi:hypothetical protein
MKIFCETSSAVINQLNVWQPTSSLLSHFYYDNLVQNPILEIKNIMKKLEIKPSDRIAKKIWKQLSFQQLSTAPRDHFWSGGSGKWEKYFKDEHISFLKDKGIEEVLESGNYIDELNAFKKRSAHISPDEWQSHCEDKLLNDVKNSVKNFYGDENHNTSTFLQNLHGKANCIAGDYFNITGSDIEKVKKIESMLNKQYIKTIVLSSAHPEFRIV